MYSRIHCMNRVIKLCLTASVLLIVASGLFLRPEIAAGKGPVRRGGRDAAKPMFERKNGTPQGTGIRANSPDPLPVREILPSVERTPADWRAFAPAQITVQLRPGVALPFEVTKVETNNGRTVLTARIAKSDPGEGNGLDNAFMVSTANSANSYEAIVVLPGEEYRLHISGDRTIVEQVPLTSFNCGTAPAADRLGLGSPQAAPAVLAVVAANSATAVDVLFLA